MPIIRYRRPFLYGGYPREIPREQRDLLFTVAKAKAYGIHLYGRSVAFEWDCTDYDKPRRRGLYMGRPYCPEHLNYVKWWANKEIREFSDKLNHLDLGDEESEKFYRARRALAKRLLWQAEEGWVDIEFYEISPDVPDAYIYDMWRLNPERLLRESTRN